MPTDEAGPSMGPLFLESDLGEAATSVASEALPAGLVELEGMIRAQTTALQNQPHDPGMAHQQDGAHGRHSR